MTSKLEEALAWLAEDPEHRTVYRAARKFGQHESTIHRVLERRRTHATCPMCGSSVLVKTDDTELEDL